MTSDVKELLARAQTAIRLGERMGVRGAAPSNIYNVAAELATALEALQAELEGVKAKNAKRWDIVCAQADAAESLVTKLREGLRPFGELGQGMLPQSNTDTSPWATAPDATTAYSPGLTFGDFRAAARLYAETEPQEEQK